jgi:hypothetical protein
MRNHRLSAIGLLFAFFLLASGSAPAPAAAEIHTGGNLPGECHPGIECELGEGTTGGGSGGGGGGGGGPVGCGSTLARCAACNGSSECVPVCSGYSACTTTTRFDGMGLNRSCRGVRSGCKSV